MPIFKKSVTKSQCSHDKFLLKFIKYNIKNDNALMLIFITFANFVSQTYTIISLKKKKHADT